MCRIAAGRRVDNRRFQRIVASFLTRDGLPFADVLSAERIERVFSEHDNLFGMNTIYSTKIVLWAFLAQVLRDGKEASCRAAVAQIATCRLQDGLTYCQTLLSRIASCEVADRPGRIEPRVIKRRRHRYRLMRKPRTELKAELQNRNSR